MSSPVTGSEKGRLIITTQSRRSSWLHCSRSSDVSYQRRQMLGGATCSTGLLLLLVVNRKRRYRVWQFDRFRGVLEGVAPVGRTLPESWSAGTVRAFITAQTPALKLVTQAQWLLLKRDPISIIAAIADSCET